MAGLDAVTSGETRVGETLISELSDKELTLLRRQRLGFIFQAFNLVPTLTAEENILLPLMLGGREADAAWASQVIESLQLDDRLTHRPDELSGGQQQRVAVARALVSRPDIIFADEPTGNLDSKAGHEVLGFLRRAVDDWKQTVVMVTHDPGCGVVRRRRRVSERRQVGRRAACRRPTDQVIDRIKGLEA